jgi:DNA-3-methyladenine glycosylase
MKHDTFSWLNTSAEEAAQRLLGCELVCEVDGSTVRVRVVETEAYDETDEASHAFGGRRKRNATMFQSAGHLYVYFTYGMHYCCNIVCGEDGFGSGVLIRAVEPLEGLDILEARRGVTGVTVTNGPAKTCAALGIDLHLNGHDLSAAPVRLIKLPPLSKDLIVAAKRVGISKEVHALRRFYIAGNSYVSKK